MTGSASRQGLIAAIRRAPPQGAQPTMDEFAAAAGVSLRTLYRLFGSRRALLEELDYEIPTSTRVRVLEAALELVGSRGLAELAMDDLAARAAVSHSTLYRLFPGKSHLFAELIRTYSPWEAVAGVLDAAPDGSPELVMPAVGRALAGALEGRTGLLLRMVSEMVRGDPDTIDGVRQSLGRGLPDLVRYLGGQMAAGRLRRIHPVIALQLLAGPIVVHFLTRPLASLAGFDSPTGEVVDQVVKAWLRAMAPE